MLKFLASPSLCKPFRGSLNSGRSVLCKNAGKPDTECLVRERIVTSMLEKTSSGLNDFLSLPGPPLRQNQQTVSPPF